MKAFNKKIKKALIGIFLLCSFLARANSEADPTSSCHSSFITSVTRESVTTEVKGGGFGLNFSLKSHFSTSVGGPNKANDFLIQSSIESFFLMVRDKHFPHITVQGDLSGSIKLETPISEWEQSLQLSFLQKTLELLIFENQVTARQLANSIDFLMQEEWSRDLSWSIIKTLTKENGIFSFPNLVLPKDPADIDLPYNGYTNLLLRAIDAENPKMVAIILGLGANVYAPSIISESINPYSLSFSESASFSTKVQYPIPLALEIFANKGGYETADIQQIILMLLERSNPSFRYTSKEVWIQKRNGRSMYHAGQSDLLLVARRGNGAMMQFLIERGHSVHVRDHIKGGVQAYANTNNSHKKEILRVLQEDKDRRKAQ